LIAMAGLRILVSREIETPLRFTAKEESTALFPWFPVATIAFYGPDVLAKRVGRQRNLLCVPDS
jgi:hypothetical protein